MRKNKLAIAIPTYNRPDILEKNLLIMMPKIIEHNITVYISDDSNNDYTRVAMERMISTYPNIKYYKNRVTLGHDANCIRTLKLVKEEYVWYLGDSRIITDKGFDRIIECINDFGYDYIVVSYNNRASYVPTQLYLDYKKFFNDLAWHATMTGVTIYRNTFSQEFSVNQNEYTNFIQLGILLNELTKDNRTLFWINENLILSENANRTSYWQKETIKVFAEDWYDFVMSLPKSYDMSYKKIVIRSHSRNTGIFKFKNYIKLRIQKVLNLQSFCKYRKKLKYATSLNLLFVFLIAVTPVSLLRLVIYFTKLGKRL